MSHLNGCVKSLQKNLQFLLHSVELKHVLTTAPTLHVFNYLMQNCEIWNIKFINSVSISINWTENVFWNQMLQLKHKNCLAFSDYWAQVMYFLFISCLLLKEDLSLFSPLFFFLAYLTLLINHTDKYITMQLKASEQLGSARTLKDEIFPSGYLIGFADLKKKT